MALFQILPIELIEELSYKLPYYKLSELQTTINKFLTLYQDAFYWKRRAMVLYGISPETYLHYYITAILELNEPLTPAQNYTQTIIKMNKIGDLGFYDPGVEVFDGITKYYTPTNLLIEVAISGNIDDFKYYLYQLYPNVINMDILSILTTFIIKSRYKTYNIDYFKEVLFMLANSFAKDQDWYYDANIEDVTQADLVETIKEEDLSKLK